MEATIPLHKIEDFDLNYQQYFHHQYFGVRAHEQRGRKTGEKVNQFDDIKSEACGT